MNLEGEVSAGAVVFRDEETVLYLALYKKAHEHYRAAWGFPRGWVEKGESTEETARREIEEETGIRDLEFIEGFRENIHFTYTRGGKLIDKEVNYLLAKTRSIEVKLSFEHDDYGWFNYNEALQRLTFENDKKVLRRAKKFLSKTGLDAFL
jgi:8-oxo-dGTP pyrophosphatase MutT (NUDIX family)